MLSCLAGLEGVSVMLTLDLSTGVVWVDGPAVRLYPGMSCSGRWGELNGDSGLSAFVGDFWGLTSHLNEGCLWRGFSFNCKAFAERYPLLHDVNSYRLRYRRSKLTNLVNKGL